MKFSIQLRCRPKNPYLEADNVFEVLEPPLWPARAAAGPSVDVVPVDLRHRVLSVLAAGRHHVAGLGRLLGLYKEIWSS